MDQYESKFVVLSVNPFPPPCELYMAFKWSLRWSIMTQISVLKLNSSFEVLDRAHIVEMNCGDN